MTQFDPTKFSLSPPHPHKDAIEPMLKFAGGLPMILLKPHIEGRLQVVRNGVRIATVIPRFLDTGEEMSTDGEPYELLSYPEGNDVYRGDAVCIARLLSLLQQFEGDWDKVGEAY